MFPHKLKTRKKGDGTTLNNNSVYITLKTTTCMSESDVTEQCSVISFIQTKLLVWKKINYLLRPTLIVNRYGYNKINLIMYAKKLVNVANIIACHLYHQNLKIYMRM